MATVKFVQMQKMSLSGSGASIGDTTLVLQSMVGIDGNNIVTADIGVTGYGTIEPGNGTQEEAISFTGITQNANGTATLTGVSSVMFKSPYTATTGIAKTHAGASTFILSNEAAFYGNILSYIDTAIVSGGVPATTTVTGLTKMSVAPVSPTSPIAVGDNDPRLLASGTVNYVNSILNTSIPYAVATGTSGAFTVTLASSISTLASGTYLNFLVPVTNASGVTLNVNSLGAKTIKKNATVTLASGDIVNGQVVTTAYDGTNFQLVSPASTAIVRNVTSSALSTIPTSIPLMDDFRIIVEIPSQSGTNNILLDFNSGASGTAWGYNYHQGVAAYTAVNGSATMLISNFTTAAMVQYIIIDVKGGNSLGHQAWARALDISGGNGAPPTFESFGVWYPGGGGLAITTVNISASAGTLAAGTRISIYPI